MLLLAVSTKQVLVVDDSKQSMAPVVITTTATQIFEESASVNERRWANDGAEIRVARTAAALSGGGGVLVADGHYEVMIGGNEVVGRPFYAVTGSGTSLVYRDEE